MMATCRSLVFLVVLITGGTALAASEPRYEILKKYEDFEVRRYPALLVAETEVTGNFSEVGNQAFPILASFIGGENSGKTEISMTAPVVQSPSEPSKGAKIAMTSPVLQEPAKTDNTSSFVVAFIMPSEYTLETLPVPRDPRVVIRQIPERTMAVRRYSGSWDEKKYIDQEKMLLGAMTEVGLTPSGKSVFARYNPPFIPSFLRRNEVMIELENWKPLGETRTDNGDQ